MKDVGEMTHHGLEYLHPAMTENMARQDWFPVWRRAASNNRVEAC